MQDNRKANYCQKTVGSEMPDKNVISMPEIKWALVMQEYKKSNDCQKTVGSEIFAKNVIWIT